MKPISTWKPPVVDRTILLQFTDVAIMSYPRKATTDSSDYTFVDMMPGLPRAVERRIDAMAKVAK